jgi:hypothetical protein
MVMSNEVRPHSLITLDLAAMAIYLRLYGRPADERGLDAMANMIRALVPLYAYQDGGVGIRHLTAADLSGGFFRGGAREIRFVDGRPRIWPIAVTAQSVESVSLTIKSHASGAMARAVCLREQSTELFRTTKEARERARGLRQAAREARRTGADLRHHV